MLISVALCTLGAQGLYGEQKQNTNARLQIQVVVIPTIVAAQQTRSDVQPSQAPVRYSLGSDNKNAAIYSYQSFVPPANAAQARPALLETMTIVVE